MERVLHGATVTPSATLRTTLIIVRSHTYVLLAVSARSSAVQPGTIACQEHIRGSYLIDEPIHNQEERAIYVYGSPSCVNNSSSRGVYHTCNVVDAAAEHAGAISLELKVTPSNPGTAVPPPPSSARALPHDS
ncbi:hypothetical protein DPEC_G00291520 [Dallia pectoralis]|uniref:Uncharacterized protein n=1 Tax=Dallia pectoralis TaxID=75939 RepID=A0ACC2FHS2_DALPE|nr:hypothetical protein DPEC_G00291520 [Dallia pectoralis]